MPQTHIGNPPHAGEMSELTREVHNLLGLAAQVGRFSHKPKIVARRYFKVPPQAATSATIATPDAWDASQAWRAFVRDALKTRHRMVKGVRLATRIRTRLPTAGIDPASEKYGSTVMNDWPTNALRARVLGLLAQYRIDARLIEAVDRHLTAHHGKWSGIGGINTFAEAVAVLEQSTAKFGQYVGDKILVAGTTKARRRTLAELSVEHESVEIPCDALPYPASVVCYVIAVVLVVIALVTLLVTFIESFIDWIQEDDRARAEINRRSCSRAARVVERGSR
jgi:hypothetical protein